MTFMPRRKRKHISLKTKLAATLACLLPQSERDEMRREKVSADAVLRRFEFDHVVLHTHDGSDEWHNLTPMIRAEHREKSRKDAGIVAKMKRLCRAQKNGVKAGIYWADQVKTFAETNVKKKRPSRRIAQRANPWPPRGSRPFRKKLAPEQRTR